MSLVDDIIAKPLEFGRKYAIEIDTNSANFGNQFKSKTVNTTQNTINTFDQVRGNARIRTAGFEQQMGRCYVMLDDSTKNPAPIYYLHWALNSICRITLKPSGGAKSPRLFFTANLNGCMVVVEGKRDCPSVYHANADAAGPSTAGPRYNPNPLTETQAKGTIDTKVQTMQQAFSDMSRQFDKRGKTNKLFGGLRGSTTSTAATQHQYDLLLGRNSGNVSQTLHNLGVRQGHRQFVDVVGTVFGVRKKDDWAFYYQRSIVYDQFDDKGTPMRGGVFVDLCHEFWPKGNGRLCPR